jgi:hypothetical protein
MTRAVEQGANIVVTFFLIQCRLMPPVFPMTRLGGKSVRSVSD